MTTIYQSLPASTAGIAWKVTNRLRWFGTPKSPALPMLQQLWISDQGAEEWHDIPYELNPDA